MQQRKYREERKSFNFSKDSYHLNLSCALELDCHNQSIKKSWKKDIWRKESKSSNLGSCLISSICQKVVNWQSTSHQTLMQYFTKTLLAPAVALEAKKKRLAIFQRDRVLEKRRRRRLHRRQKPHCYISHIQTAYFYRDQVL